MCEGWKKARTERRTSHLCYKTCERKR